MQNYTKIGVFLPHGMGFGAHWHNLLKAGLCFLLCHISYSCLMSAHRCYNDLTVGYPHSAGLLCWQYRLNLDGHRRGISSLLCVCVGGHCFACVHVQVND